MKKPFENQQILEKALEEVSVMTAKNMIEISYDYENPRALEQKDKKARKFLRENKVSFKELSKDEFLTYEHVLYLEYKATENGLFPESRASIKQRTALYEVTPSSESGKGRPSPEELFFRHPEFSKFYNELKKAGYKLVIDSSLPTQGVNGWERFDLKLVGLKPRATWSQFLHEFEHFKISRVLERLSLDVTAQKDVDISQVPPEMRPLVEKISSLAKKGLGYKGIHETLATEAQAQNFKEAGYSTWNPEVIKVEAYGLSHQIAEITKIPFEKRTPVQQSTLKDAWFKLRIANLKNLVYTIGPVLVFAAATAGGGAMVGIIYSNSAKNDDEKKKRKMELIMIDGNGQVKAIDQKSVDALTQVPEAEFAK